jgi:hypothetical protein
MSETDLENRLHSLGELSRPTRPALGVDELHRGAERVNRRRQLMVAMPSVVVGLALAAGALALRGEAPVAVDATGTTLTSAVPGATAGLTDRDRELLDFVRATVDLRQQVVLESIETARFTSTPTTPRDLAPQRNKTDEAIATFRETVAAVEPGRDFPSASDALKQFDNRIRQLPTLRHAADGVQNDALGLIEMYKATLDDLLSTERGVVAGTSSPALFRRLLSHANLGSVTNAESQTAALLTASVEIGYYATVLPGGSSKVPERSIGIASYGCDDDALAAGDRCKSYKHAIEANDAFSLAETMFDSYADIEQKQIKRTADAGLRYDDLKRAAIDDGVGRNDLRGTSPGSVAVDPDEFRNASVERLTRLFDAERRLLDLLR